MRILKFDVDLTVPLADIGGPRDVPSGFNFFHFHAVLGVKKKIK